MDKIKLSIPISIVLAAIILGSVFYVIQINKQSSIERQQQIERQENKEQQDLENKRAELKFKQDECIALSSGVKQRWNNVVGVSYDELWKDCVVTYSDTKTGEITTSPLKFMKDTK